MNSKTNKIFLSSYQTLNIPNGYTLQLLADSNSLKNNTVDEIFLKDVIGSYDDETIKDFIDKVVLKLKPNGLLYIQDIDIEQFCVYLANKAIHFSDKKLLYKHRNNIFNISQIINIIKNIKSINIQQINFVNGYEFYIMAQKHAQ